MPLLWFRVASDGSGTERYTLQVPFQLGSPHRLTAEDARHLHLTTTTWKLSRAMGLPFFA